MSWHQCRFQIAQIRRAAEAVDSLSDAALAVRMLGWALILPVLKVAVSLEKLVQLMAIDGSRSQRNLEAERRIGRLARLAHRTAGAGRRDNCLERSLIAYRYLSAANADPVLVVGASRGGTGIEGHVWLLVDGEPIADSSDEIRRYVPLTAFGSGGRIAPMPMRAAT